MGRQAQRARSIFQACVLAVIVGSWLFDETGGLPFIPSTTWLIVCGTLLVTMIALSLSKELWEVFVIYCKRER